MLRPALIIHGGAGIARSHMLASPVVTGLTFQRKCRTGPPPRIGLGIWHLPALGGSARLTRMTAPRGRVYDLFVLNIALQLFDAVATYQGLQFGCGEANPLLRDAFELFGVLPALLQFKAVACGLLFLMNRHATHAVVATGLAATAGAYSVFSLCPWLGRFAALLAQSI
jgi:hypothetical protein